MYACKCIEMGQDREEMRKGDKKKGGGGTRVLGMVSEPNQILDRVGLNERLEGYWAKRNGSQIRHGQSVQYPCQLREKDISFPVLHPH